MAINNTVKLIGNMGSEARIIENEETTFAAFSLATTDSYKDQNDEWQDKETLWHNILIFNPRLIELFKSLKSGTRLEITGSLSYRPFEVVSGEGEVFTKKEASIIAGKVEMAPIFKKD
ncbi:MAG: single-stranded DNA-binding protein [Bacteroidota bacterium]